MLLLLAGISVNAACWLIQCMPAGPREYRAVTLLSHACSKVNVHFVNCAKNDLTYFYFIFITELWLSIVASEIYNLSHFIISLKSCFLWKKKKWRCTTPETLAGRVDENHTIIAYWHAYGWGGLHPSPLWPGPCSTPGKFQRVRSTPWNFWSAPLILCWEGLCLFPYCLPVSWAQHPYSKPPIGSEETFFFLCFVSSAYRL